MCVAHTVCLKNDAKKEMNILYHKFQVLFKRFLTRPKMRPHSDYAYFVLHMSTI